MQGRRHLLRRRAARLLQRLAFVLCVAAVLVVWSEKAYWYVQGWAFVELVAVYALPAGVMLWVASSVRASGWRAAILLGALFALLLEGIVTPVLYEDGPLPVLTVYFVGWHGVGSVVVLWYGARRFLLRGQPGRLAATAAACGVVFGTWSLTYWLPESATDPDLVDEGFDVGRWSTGRFALYAIAFAAVLAAAHLLLDRLWQRQLTPSRVGLGIVAIGLGVFAVPTLVAVPWAPLKLGVLLVLVRYGLRRLARADGATLLEELDGTFPARRIWPLALLPATAIAVYAIASETEPGEGAIRAVTETGVTIGVGVVGAIALVVASWRRREGSDTEAERLRDEASAPPDPLSARAIVVDYRDDASHRPER